MSIYFFSVGGKVYYNKIKANGVKAALKEVSGITDEKILEDVVAIYEAM